MFLVVNKNLPDEFCVKRSVFCKSGLLGREEVESILRQVSEVASIDIVCKHHGIEFMHFVAGSKDQKATDVNSRLNAALRKIVRDKRKLDCFGVQALRNGSSKTMRTGRARHRV